MFRGVVFFPDTVYIAAVIVQLYEICGLRCTVPFNWIYFFTNSLMFADLCMVDVYYNGLTSKTYATLLTTLFICSSLICGHLNTSFLLLPLVVPSACLNFEVLCR